MFSLTIKLVANYKWNFGYEFGKSQTCNLRVHKPIFKWIAPNLPYMFLKQPILFNYWENLGSPKQVRCDVTNFLTYKNCTCVNLSNLRTW